MGRSQRHLYQEQGIASDGTGFPSVVGGAPAPGTPLTITSPTEGATVPPVHDIIGTGADPSTQVDLKHQGVVVASVASDADGNWGFVGDTPAALGEVTWTVHAGSESAFVNIIVVDEPVSRSKKQ